LKIVVDTSSFFYGFQMDGRNEYFTTYSVLDEVRGKTMKRELELRMDLFKLFEPSQSSIEKVRNVARETGDLDQLSVTDIELIALAVDKGAFLLSNDLAIQNVCMKVGVKYLTFSGKQIKTEIEWAYRCIGCGREFEKYHDDCPYCGSELKRYPKRRRAIRGPT
jgi:UPF0271 protein